MIRTRCPQGKHDLGQRCGVRASIPGTDRPMPSLRAPKSGYGSGIRIAFPPGGQRYRRSAERRCAQRKSTGRDTAIATEGDPGTSTSADVHQMSHTGLSAVRRSKARVAAKVRPILQPSPPSPSLTRSRTEKARDALRMMNALWGSETGKSQFDRRSRQKWRGCMESLRGGKLKSALAPGGDT